MSNKSRLWQIFGPVICAFLLLIGVFLIPWERTFSPKNIFRAAISQNNNVFRGERLKQTAFKGKYVPFYGSSELSRFDPLHPSVLAYKYHRSYTPFLLGGPGSQSLTQFFNMQETSSQMRGKKAVFIVSPQWFTPQGQIPEAFTLYYSQLQATDWLLNAKNSVGSRYAARRLLQMPSSTSSRTIKQALMTIASGQKLSASQTLALQVRQRMLLNEDTFFTMTGMNNRVKKVYDNAKLLPAQYDPASLHKVADEQGAKNTNSNKFGIDNNFFGRRLNGGKLAGLKNSQTSYNYEKSPEYADFQLVLQEFAKNHQQVLFIIPPVNAKWAAYTGLSQKRYQKSVNKITRQLIKQGFYHIADLSRDGGKQYFMQDTIHLGWNGWLAVDRYVKPFMAQKMVPSDYRLDDYYFTKDWCNKTNVKAAKVQNRRQLHAASIENILHQQRFIGSTLIVKNGKVVLNYNQGDADRNTKQPNTANTAFLINSVQKLPTAILLEKAVTAGKMSWNDKLSKYYPAVPHANQITLRQMSQMASGLALKPSARLGSDKFASNQQGIKDDIKHTVFLKQYYNQRFYSPINYVLLAGAWEKATGRSYEAAIRSEIINKLGLRHTAFIWDSPATLDKVGLAKSYGYVDSKHSKLTETDLNMDELHGEFSTGSLVMSNKDLYKLLHATFNGKLLTAKQRADVFQSKMSNNESYGGGLYDYGFCYGNNGSGYNYSTFIRLSKDNKTTVVMQTNVPVGNYWHMREAAHNIMKIAMQN
jgi:D-alanine transfer protein